jgi:hypothetical protein
MNIISLFVCEKCEKNLSSKQGLTNHKSICGVIKPSKIKQNFICDHCNVELASKRGLNKHIEICGVFKAKKEHQALMEKERLTFIEKEKQALIEKKLIDNSKTIQNLEFEIRVKDFELEQLRQYKSEKDLEISKLRQEYFLSQDRKLF